MLRKMFKVIMMDCLCVYRSHFKCWVSLWPRTAVLRLENTT